MAAAVQLSGEQVWNYTEVACEGHHPLHPVVPRLDAVVVAHVLVAGRPGGGDEATLGLETGEGGQRRPCSESMCSLCTEAIVLTHPRAVYPRCTSYFSGLVAENCNSELKRLPSPSTSLLHALSLTSYFLFSLSSSQGH